MSAVQEKVVPIGDYKAKGRIGKVEVLLVDGGRVCVGCEQGKAWDEFVKDKNGYNQKTATCRSCRKERSRRFYLKNPRSGYKNRLAKVKSKYGVTWDHVKQTLALQLGRCANRACGKEISLDVPMGKTRAVIDHCHATGKFRGVICAECNWLLGILETKENINLGLLEYAAKHK